ncbi:hypothetical protein VEGS18_A37820 [Escherichia coli]|nr:hypothetical protein VEGS18_A37820 [Escherichia coli]
MGEISVKTGNNARNGGKNSLNRLIRCVCGKKIGPDPRNFNQRVNLGRNDLLIRTFLIFDQILNAYDSFVYANDDIENLQQFMEMQRKMIIAQLIYYFGIAVSTSYLTVSLRNHFMSNLSLNDGRIRFRGNDSNLLIVFYVQIMPDDFVMQLHRF